VVAIVERSERCAETEQHADDDAASDRDGDDLAIAPRAHQLLDQRIRISSHPPRVAVLGKPSRAGNGYGRHVAEVGEILTLEGRVGAEGEHAVFVHATVKGGRTRMRLTNRRRFVLLSDDGRVVRISVPEAATARPERWIAGPWVEIQMHRTYPAGVFAHDARVELAGVWVLPGERIRVQARVSELEFVSYTGGARLAPDERVAELEALEIEVIDPPDTRRAPRGIRGAIAALIARLRGA
jgi:hypothetical protein